jgi:hypothetical protein
VHITAFLGVPIKNTAEKLWRDSHCRNKLHRTDAGSIGRTVLDLEGLEERLVLDVALLVHTVVVHQEGQQLIPPHLRIKDAKAT